MVYNTAKRKAIRSVLGSLVPVQFQIFAALVCLLGLPTNLFSNNIQVSSVRKTGQDTSAGTHHASNFTMVEFNLSWENSWRVSNGPTNWDAAWVFVKFRVGVSDPIFTGVSSSGTTVTVSNTSNLRVGMPVLLTSGTGVFAANTVIQSITNSTQFVVSATPSTALSNASITCRRIWEHARLDASSGNHTAPTGSTIDVPSDSTGAFIYRSSNGVGTFSLTDVQLRWNYGAQGVYDDAATEVKVFGIEMVYVPQGSFAAGSGGAEASAFTLTTINTATATTAPSGTGSLGGQGGGYPTSQTAPDNASWPNGYDAFYCMKYELSQGQYRDFLNTLTYTQQNSRTASAASAAAGTGAMTPTNLNRNGLDVQTSGVAVTFTPAVYACNLDVMVFMMKATTENGLPAII